MTRTALSVGCIALAVAAQVSNASPLAAQAAGEQWEYTGTMEMMGMKMPMPPTKMCQKPDEAKTPPVQSNCTVSDVKVQGNTTSFKMMCGPPERMEGSGTTTRTADRLETTYRMKSADGEMTYNMSGKKTGACTP
jgi:hypothetical protein